jgi:hypothetical protein
LPFRGIDLAPEACGDVVSVCEPFLCWSISNDIDQDRPRLPVSGIAREAIEKATLPAPAIFAPGVISGPGNDGTPTFSPDGRTLCFYRYGTSPDSAVIFESHRTSARWSKPVAAPFSGPSSDQQTTFGDIDLSKSAIGTS